MQIEVSCRPCCVLMLYSSPLLHITEIFWLLTSSFFPPRSPQDVRKPSPRRIDVDCELLKYSRNRFKLEELKKRPLPEGVDPAMLETYLSDSDFQVMDLPICLGLVYIFGDCSVDLFSRFKFYGFYELWASFNSWCKFSQNLRQN